MGPVAAYGPLHAQRLLTCVWSARLPRALCLVRGSPTCDGYAGLRPAMGTRVSDPPVIGEPGIKAKI